MVTADGQVYLLDFGIAKLLTEGEAKETELTRIGGRALTPDYAAPEQIAGAPITTAADVYALGVILYELLTGVRPFQGDRRLLWLQLLEDEPRPPRRLNEQIPRDLETICLKAMAKSPGRRYRTAQEFAEDLRRFHDGKPIKARPPSMITFVTRASVWTVRFFLVMAGWR